MAMSVICLIIHNLINLSICWGNLIKNSAEKNSEMFGNRKYCFERWNSTIVSHVYSAAFAQETYVLRGNSLSHSLSPSLHLSLFHGWDAQHFLFSDVCAQIWTTSLVIVICYFVDSFLWILCPVSFQKKST